jgi:hypothetical protein
MTRFQFAMSVGASEKWVENAGRLLGRRFKLSLQESVWLGLVRTLNQDLEIPLKRAAALADEALGTGKEGAVIVGRSDASTVGVSIDMPRYRSSHAAAASASLTLGGPRRRGRQSAPLKRKVDAIEKAKRYGVDIDLLREGLKLSYAQRLEQLDANAQFARSIRKVKKR